MADFYFHYTSRVASQMIISTGQIFGAPESGVHLTDELFESCSKAAALLGIPVVGPEVTTQFRGTTVLTKAIEIVCCIPATRINTDELIGPELARPFRDWATGRIIFPGGGRQFRYEKPIDIRDLSWITPVSP